MLNESSKCYLEDCACFCLIKMEGVSINLPAVKKEGCPAAQASMSNNVCMPVPSILHDTHQCTQASPAQRSAPIFLVVYIWAVSHGSSVFFAI